MFAVLRFTSGCECAHPDAQSEITQKASHPDVSVHIWMLNQK